VSLQEKSPNESLIVTEPEVGFPPEAVTVTDRLALAKYVEDPGTEIVVVVVVDAAATPAGRRTNRSGTSASATSDAGIEDPRGQRCRRRITILSPVRRP